ncbi:hypothetical protein HFO63_14940 [Rhizobium laguerreae]|uniref:hypothetical protein n=1 Tax=Rhizobium laguerreae TaxID=1076926 RepID=UPI001C91E7D6|nr:hypothetical protein [Rhizobium laguerreae]MBY3082737.1 hypothetical protein [Rhizobium laguerreae]MBY3146874.1 hypothetical protein [Rhizobium laguerreae]
MSSQSRPLHVFAAVFETREKAFAFGHPHWGPEPADDVSNEEYAAWEDRNPQWPMKSELRCRTLDSDFVEVIWETTGSEPEAVRHIYGRC